METQEHTRGGADSYSVTRIGTIRRGEKGIELAIDKPYRVALNGLDGFSHAQVLWWFDRFDSVEHRSTTTLDPPFPAPTLGVFALKSPMRPNPIGLSTVRVLDADTAAGIIRVPRIDAFDGTPVLDIKAYMPSFDRVAEPEIPEWAASWPDFMPDDGIDVDRLPDE
jgi:tRNA-Thr(GGU) m(6)t(6)A37 methyltransferase TsaA